MTAWFRHEILCLAKGQQSIMLARSQVMLADLPVWSPTRVINACQACTVLLSSVSPSIQKHAGQRSVCLLVLFAEAELELAQGRH